MSSPAVFECIGAADVDGLLKFNSDELQPILPVLVRLGLCQSLDPTNEWKEDKNKVLRLLCGNSRVDWFVQLLSVDYHELEQDCKKEQQLRLKAGGSASESILLSNLSQSAGLEFEHSVPSRQLRLVLSELLTTNALIKEQSSFTMKSSELMDCDVFIDDISAILCIIQPELPSLLPVTELCETLVHFQHGVHYLTRLVANLPDSYTEVCKDLIGRCESRDTLGCSRRSEALLQLCEMSPRRASGVRQLCIDQEKLPELVLELSLRDTDTLVPCLTTLLLAGSQQLADSWFSDFLSAQLKNKLSGSCVSRLRTELVGRVQAITPSVRGRAVNPSDLGTARDLLRLYCLLKTTVHWSFSEDETKSLVSLMTSPAPPTTSGAQFVITSLYTLLACAKILSGASQEERVVRWLLWLVRPPDPSAHEAGDEGDRGAGYLELLLLLAIHLHSGQLTQVAQLVSANMNIKGVVKTGSLARIKTMFTQDVFTEQMVTSIAARVPVEQNLCRRSSDRLLSAHCIHQLLKTRAFSKHRVNIKDWIYSQMLCSTTPLHPVLPPLIDSYITSVITPAARTELTNQPITEQQIMAVFTNESLCTDATTSQLLLLYYVLQYRSVLISNTKLIAQKHSSSSSRPVAYSDSLLRLLPIKQLFSVVLSRQTDYQPLYSNLLRLVTSQYPQLITASDWLVESESLRRKSVKTSITAKHIITAMTSVDTQAPRLVSLLQRLTSLPWSALHQKSELCSAFASQLHLLLPPDVPRAVTSQALEVWRQLNAVMPRELWLESVRSLSVVGAAPTSYETLENDPLCVLRCDPGVYRRAELLQMVLTVLSGCLQASNTALEQHALLNPLVGLPPSQSGAVQEREELRKSLVLLQQSAAVQMLLEACLPHDDEDPSSELSSARECRGIICEHIHQMFISDPALVKTVHFQGYPSCLLPMTVRGIQSMHVCLDFVPELLQQPHYAKQVFAVQLVGQLCTQYALPKTFNIAQLSLSVLQAMLKVIPSRLLASYYSSVLPSVSLMCRSFPPLCEDAVPLLTSLGRVAHATSCVSSATDCRRLAEKRKLQGHADEPLIKRGKVSSTELLKEVQQTITTITNNTVLGRLV